jgi:DmsE family decaheme c-type cytochrome
MADIFVSDGLITIYKGDTHAMKHFKLYMFLVFSVMIMLTLAVDNGIVGAFGSQEYDDDVCAECHTDIAENLHANVHGRIRAFETANGKTGCQTCHVNADEHVDSGGDPDVITAFYEMDAEMASGQCLSCHQNAAMAHWNGSTHSAMDVSCVDCHGIHPSEGKPAYADCDSCHSDVTAQMSLPSHHPVPEGKMDCMSCHNPHGTLLDGMIKGDERKNDLCLECHAGHNGPFVFEHSPVVEDCGICHVPHGSMVNNMLTESEPYLCLQCHEMHFHTGAVGLDTTEVYDANRDIVQRNDLTSFSWKAAFATKCTQCHVSVHGSDLPSQGITSQGGSLTR